VMLILLVRLTVAYHQYCCEHYQVTAPILLTIESIIQVIDIQSQLINDVENDKN
jgi:HJR/Mrr/RecB family endonuclease